MGPERPSRAAVLVRVGASGQRCRAPYLAFSAPISVEALDHRLCIAEHSAQRINVLGGDWLQNQLPSIYLYGEARSSLKPELSTEGGRNHYSSVRTHFMDPHSWRESLGLFSVTLSLGSHAATVRQRTSACAPARGQSGAARSDTKCGCAAWCRTPLLAR
jgi:hypothetical protein